MTEESINGPYSMRFISAAEQRVHDGGEVAGDFFRRLPHVAFDPPVNGFDKSAGEMVAQKISGHGGAFAFFVIEPIFAELQLQMLFEITQKDIATVGTQESHKGFALITDVVENVRGVRAVTVALRCEFGNGTMHADAGENMAEEFGQKRFHERLFCGKVGVKCTAPDIGGVDDLLHGDLRVTAAG